MNANNISRTSLQKVAFSLPMPMRHFYDSANFHTIYDMLSNFDTLHDMLTIITKESKY